MNVNHWYVAGWVCVIEEVTSYSGGAAVWGNRQTGVKYKSVENVHAKQMWQREEKDTLTKLSVNQPLDPEKKYRFWLKDDDSSDEAQARIPKIIRPVRDARERFVHTVVEFA